MRLRGRRESRNIEDRRGQRRGGGGVRIGGFGLLAVLAIGWFTGADIRPLLNALDPGAAPDPGRSVSELTESERQAGRFVSQVLGTTEDVWSAVFRQQLGAVYEPPVLVLFSGATASPCGNASGATGPFYCPADEKAYLDVAFFSFMRDELGAEGDFAGAYVIAHEVAHHVQHELGVLGQVNALRQTAGTREANALTVRLELQADCLSGVWARNVQGLLEPGDLDEALNAARRIGDDYLQKRAGRVPNPHSFTHGTSEQRQNWFAQGFETGDINACDTFNATAL
ncbi:neutral zinc metallopeptidase [Cognatishimia sp. F0-27]|uniref:KPN_02809 family neutral zinc metallopeptidase n=1 Tax=Cognatishimia sp. F0-27 TaxID=2816855 RepID=UPI001D0C76F0|nr:neutral zinc metallopeptidase [Cognatishimia sp. F0-27]MCC1492234.1 neutral zinc metallopeptidase [Cognatishimia sp. F0-27]